MSRSRASLQFICVYNIRLSYIIRWRKICVPWGGRGCRDLKVRWWDVSYLAMWPGVCSLSRGVSVMYDVILWFWLLLHIALNFSLKLCTTWWWPLWPKHVVVSYLPPYSYIIIINIVVFDFYPLFIHCINTQRGCHTLKLQKWDRKTKQGHFKNYQDTRRKYLKCFYVGNRTRLISSFSKTEIYE